jgi:hypothetical protein
MSNRTYLVRLCDKELQNPFHAIGAILTEGAKWSEKTRIATNAAHSVLYLQDPDNKVFYIAMADTKPSLLLEGDTPR